MKKVIGLVLAVFSMVLLVACGGGGSGSGSSSPTSSATQPTVLLDLNSSRMEVHLANSEKERVAFVNDGNPIAISFDNISSFGWNDSCKGWRASGGAGIFVDPKLEKFDLASLNQGGVGNWSAIEHGGRELFVNLKEVHVIGGDFIIKDNLFYYGTAVARDANNVLIPNENFSCPNNTTPPVASEQDTIIRIFPGNRIEIDVAVENGKVVNLAGLPETVLDGSSNVISGYRIVWNDVNNWYPAAGIIQPLAMPKTTISIATANGSGMPYLVRPDGTFISFDTSRCQVFINGTEVTNAVGDNGLINY